MPGRFTVGTSTNFKVGTHFLRIGPLGGGVSAGFMQRLSDGTLDTTDQSSTITVPLGALCLIAIHAPSGPKNATDWLPTDLSSDAISGITLVDSIDVAPGIGGLALFKAIGTGVQDRVTFDGTGSFLTFIQFLIAASTTAFITDVDDYAIDATAYNTLSKTSDVSLPGEDFRDIWTVAVFKNMGIAPITTRLRQEWGTGFAQSQQFNVDTQIIIDDVERYSLSDGAHNTTDGAGNVRWVGDWQDIGGGGNAGYICAVTVKHNRL